MKRCLYFECLAFCCFLLVGCGNTKSLNCSSKSFLGDTTTTSQDFVIGFKNEVISSVSMDFDVTLKDIDDVTKDSLQSSVNDTFGTYKDLSGVDYSAKVRDDGFNVKIKVNFNKISDSDKKKIVFINYDKNYEQTKEELENNGFTCK